MCRVFDFDPDGLAPLVAASPIRVKKASRSRALTDTESLSLALGALGTLGRTRGVKVANVEMNGSSAAVVVIENARFSADAGNNTTLSHVMEGAAEKEFK